MTVEPVPFIPKYILKYNPHRSHLERRLKLTALGPAPGGVGQWVQGRSDSIISLKLR